jgi:transcriptional regulator with XRE-family HTH domain
VPDGLRGTRRGATTVCRVTTSRDDGPSYLGRLRRGAGLTQERLAQLSELSVRTVRNLEYGSVAHPHADSLMRIASVVTTSRPERQTFLAV